MALDHYPRPQAFPSAQVRRLGHDRWILENNGWNDLTQHWALKHGFLHACQHRPQATAENGERQPVANRGLAALTLILLLVFTLSSLCSLSFQTGPSLRLLRHRGGFSTECRSKVG